MSDPGGSVDRGTVREQAVKLARIRLQEAQCMTDGGPCEDCYQQADMVVRALRDAGLLRGEMPTFTPSEALLRKVLAEPLEPDPRSVAMLELARRLDAAEAERDRLRAAIEKAIEESTPDLRPVGFDGTPFPVLVPDFVLRALLAESGTPEESESGNG